MKYQEQHKLRRDASLGGGLRFLTAEHREDACADRQAVLFTLDRRTGFSSVVLLVSCVQKEKQTFLFKQIIHKALKDVNSPSNVGNRTPHPPPSSVVQRSPFFCVIHLSLGALGRGSGGSCLVM